LIGDIIPNDETDYSSYTKVAEYLGPYTDYNVPMNWKEFEVNPPHCGRYAVLQAAGGPNRCLEIRELEVWTYVN